MTDKELAELKRVIKTMPLADLTKVKQEISAELDARHGKRKYSPEVEWNRLTTRSGTG